MKVLSFDPSGNYSEGKGTTGWAISEDFMSPYRLGDIKSIDWGNRQRYWYRHEELIDYLQPDLVVIESYRLFGHKAKEQTGSELETPMMIGFIEMVCWKKKIPVIFQDPSTKTRHKDEILEKSGYVEKKGNKYYYNGKLTNLHQRDALRHNLYFCKYNYKNYGKIVEE